MADRQIALITGASAGIGKDLADVFAEHGFNLITSARNAAELERLAAELRAKFAVDVRVLPKDLSQSGAAREIVDELARQNVTLDVLVNNAGFGAHGPFAQIDPKQMLDMLQVNVVALTELTRLLLPGMLARGRGRILNVSSTAAFQPGPLMAEYYASKAYVQSLTEAIAAEVAGSGVTVTALCPGPTRTEFQKRAGMEESRLFGAAAMDSMAVARIGFAGMMRGRRIVIPGFRNRLLLQAERIAPRRVIVAVTRRLNETR